MTDRIEVEVLGIELGTAEGWDDHGDFMLQFYDFIPHEGVPIQPGDICFAFNKGVAEYYHPETGAVVGSLNLIDLMLAVRESLSRKG